MSKINRYKAFIARIPVLGTVAKAIWAALRPRPHFPGSGAYWESRYAAGGTSGSGSYDELALFKADVINGFVHEHRVTSVMEFGCGDGNQLKLARYPDYLGLDVSDAAIARCSALFSDDASKRFKNVAAYADEKADLSMSLDVIYHLVEDAVFDAYMSKLFGAASKYVIVYSSNDEGLNAKYGGYHVKHRKFTDWVAAHAPAWSLLYVRASAYPFDDADPDHTSLADFYFYQRTASVE